MRNKHTLMRKYIWILSFILISGFVFGYTLKNQDPNKDKLLLEIISYVLDRGHYDPKDFNDKFSENVFNVGALSLQNIKTIPLFEKREFSKIFKITSII